MTKQSSQPILDRRQFTTALAVAAVAAVLPDLPAFAQQATPEPKAWEVLVRKILGEAKPTEGKVMIEMAEIAENGNTVPFTLAVDSPMTDKDYVKAIHMISTANPQPNVATFHFTPASGAAKAESRMRLLGSQDVIAIAELNDGRFLMGKRPVKVTVGGCGG